MKKYWKSIFCALAVLVLSLTSLQPALAATDLKKAKTISLDKNYTGQLSITNYEQVFKVKLKKNGNLKVFVKTYKSRSWYVEVLDSEGSRLDDYYTKTTNGTETNEIGLKKGTYYIVISGNKDKPYKVQAKFKASEYYERESNNTVKTANTIKTGKNYYGALQEFTDKDYLKFTVKNKRKVSITYNNTPKEQRDILIVNAKGKVYKTVHTDYHVKKPSTSSFSLSLPKGSYHVLIQYGSGAYKIKVK
ncbi:hypothetical protein ACIQZM_13115 [Peribacillus sp. NPDC097206]|uniref:hypothetical protein n=1 Tax=unclassified Peribacillus TaxID=2675266 RepID=UPI00382104E0